MRDVRVDSASESASSYKPLYNPTPREAPPPVPVFEERKKARAPPRLPFEGRAYEGN